MVTGRLRTAVVSALVLVLGMVLSASEVYRRLPLDRGKPHVVERSGKCVLGVWSLATEVVDPDCVRIRAGVVAPRTCEPVEIKIEAIYYQGNKRYSPDTLVGTGSTKLGRWKVVPLTGLQDVRRGSVHADLDFSKLRLRLQWGDVLYVKVTARCKHGTTVESMAFYSYGVP